MIDPEEIKLQSKQLGLSIPDIQRDYVFGWILNGIYTISDLKNVLVLKGGNAFRKVYYEDTRFSGDLDFSCANLLDPIYLKGEFEKLCHYVSDNTGIVFDGSRQVAEEKKRVDKDLKVIEVKLYFNDFSGKENHIVIHVRLDISQLDRLVLPVVSGPIIHPYSDADKISSPVRVLQLEELFANKLKCMLQRRHSHDLFDLAFRLSHCPSKILRYDVVLHAFISMTVFHRAPGAAKPILLDLPLENLQGFWNKIACSPGKRIDLKQGIENFGTEIDAVFRDTYGENHSFRFFSGKHRSLVMEAGSQKKLMRITYDGTPRLCEPYSLAFRTRQTDGQSFEYLYVHDRTGSSNNPGIKMFFGHKIDDVQITNESFEPRDEIDLTKSLLIENESTFSRGTIFRLPGVRRPKLHRFPGRTPTVRVLRQPKQPKYQSKMQYVFKCGLCGKRFYREKYDGKLNPHKNKSGYQCSGGYGIYIETKYPGYR